MLTTPSPPEQAQARIKDLVERFKSLPAAERKRMNENATRQGYILPFFQALDPAQHFDELRGLERQIARLDEAIDRHVYALYGLTEEEIQVVEGGK